MLAANLTWPFIPLMRAASCPVCLKLAAILPSRLCGRAQHRDSCSLPTLNRKNPAAVEAVQAADRVGARAVGLAAAAVEQAEPVAERAARAAQVEEKGER